MTRPVLRPPRALTRLVTLIAMGLVTGVIPPTGTALAATTFTSAVVNQANGNCTTVPNGAGTSGLQLVQSSCTSGASQSFTFFDQNQKTAILNGPYGSFLS